MLDQLAGISRTTFTGSSNKTLLLVISSTKTCRLSRLASIELNNVARLYCRGILKITLPNVSSTTELDIFSGKSVMFKVIFSKSARNYCLLPIYSYIYIERRNAVAL